MKRSVNFLIAVLAVVLAVPAFAGSVPGSITVTASVANNCSIVSAPVAFGAYDPIGTNNAANLDATGTLTVTCTRGAAGVWVGLGLGSNPSGALRNMTNGTSPLNYELYTDAGRTAIWGNTAATGANVAFAGGAGLADPTTLTVYGRVPMAQDVTIGSYSDTVVATVNW